MAEFQEKALVELPAIEKIAQQYYLSDDVEQGRLKARQFLTKYTNDFARAAIGKWSELEGSFWAMYARGF